jgi:hypothetical protein
LRNHFIITTICLFSCLLCFLFKGSDSRTALDAQNSATPWQSLTKVNAFFTVCNTATHCFLSEAIHIYGSLALTRSELSGAPLVIGAYGSGEQTVINGTTVLTNCDRCRRHLGVLRAHPGSDSYVAPWWGAAGDWPLAQ